jgi:hypothetical protein
MRMSAYEWMISCFWEKSSRLCEGPRKIFWESCQSKVKSFEDRYLCKWKRRRYCEDHVTALFDLFNLRMELNFRYLVVLPLRSETLCLYRHFRTSSFENVKTVIANSGMLSHRRENHLTGLFAAALELHWGVVITHIRLKMSQNLSKNTFTSEWHLWKSFLLHRLRDLVVCEKLFRINTDHKHLVYVFNKSKKNYFEKKVWQGAKLIPRRLQSKYVKSLQLSL